MKTNNFYKICMLVIGIMLFSCDNDDNVIPPVNNDPNIPGAPLVESNITIPQLKEILPDEQDNMEITSDLILEGYVVSSDASGNFYKELYLQNHPSNPTAGIRLEINRLELYQTYEVGLKLYIHLQGLILDRGENGIISITDKNGFETPEVGDLLNSDYITKSTVVENIIAKPVLFSQITQAHIGTYVRISNTQVHRDALTLAFVDKASQYTQRILEQCDEESSFILETRNTASFSNAVLPDANGTISGIVTKGAHGENLVLMINELEAMVYEGDRCSFLACGTAGEIGDVFYEEDFEAVDGGSLEDIGWINVAIDGTEQQFIAVASEENTYVEIGAFETAKEAFESWLISPAIHLDNTTEETLTFDISIAHDNGEALSVLITDNYTGDLETTEWRTVKVAFLESPEEGFSEFTTVGMISLDCLEGDVHIAFQYQGGDPELVTTYRIDNISVAGAPIVEEE